MKNFNLIFIICAIVFSTAALGQNTTDSISDEEEKIIDLLRFEKYSYNLGKVTPGEVINFEIPFTNVSKEVVVIDFISSCDCTEVNFPEEDILPGDSTKLKVIFDSSDKTESETTDIEIFLKNREKDTGAQVYFNLEYSFEIESKKQ